MSATAMAQTDTTLMEVKADTAAGFRARIEHIIDSRNYKMTYIGVPLIVGALIVKSEDDHFRSLRNDYIPTFSHHIDDYTQYLPTVVMLGMKAAGVRGRSSWERMLISDIFSAALMSGTVYIVKHNAGVVRPDGSNQHSFPSGHTATAFMTASMLSKEYGGRSPWISVGAYTVAAGTGLMRMANNKHWLSDVMAGAGIGILSTELGYYFADLIFRDRGLNKKYAGQKNFSVPERPSHFGMYLGLNLVPNFSASVSSHHLTFTSGSTAGMEGAWFFSRNVGVGGRFTVSNMAIVLDDLLRDESLDATSTSVGMYFSYPIVPRLLLGSKLLVGYTSYNTCHLDDCDIGGTCGLNAGTGLSLTVIPRQSLGVKLFADYGVMPTPVKKDNERAQLLVIGGSVSVMF